MTREERMHKLRNGSDTAIWAADEIGTLKSENQALKAQVKMLKPLVDKRFNEGLMVGSAGSEKALKEVAVIRSDYMDENQRLTDLLLKTEAERDELREKWNYYQEFVKAHGADSITQLAARKEPPAREPLKYHEVYKGATSNTASMHSFLLGVRFAEKHHGIGGG